MTARLGPFFGAVHLHDWWIDALTDRSYHCLVGNVRILTEDDLGFKVRTVGNANYVVEVRGKQSVVTFPGCKVHGFQAFESPPTSAPNVYVVP